jgi:glucose/arabinose dehydrogenase
VSRPGEPGHLYVLEQAGRVRVVEGGRIRPRPFLDLRRRVLAGDERGLLGLAFHPDHARNGRFYVHFTDRRGDTRVEEMRAVGDRVVSPRGRLRLGVRQPYENHKGGQLAFGPDGRLHLGLGDGGSAFDPEQRGQRLSGHLAKLLSLDPERPERGWRTVAYGLRNPWRFSFDRAGGDLFLADVGQDRTEEVNVLRRSERGLVNFGWGAYEGRRRSIDRRLEGAGRLAFPHVSYGRREGCTVIGGYVYRGSALPGLRGRYLFGDLCRGTIWSFDSRTARAPRVRRERPRVELLTSFGEDASGELFATSYDGRLLSLSPPARR